MILHRNCTENSNRIRVSRSKLDLTWLNIDGACSGPEAPLKSPRISEAKLCASVLGWPLRERFFSGGTPPVV